jgi:hypothetical protein
MPHVAIHSLHVSITDFILLCEPALTSYRFFLIPETKGVPLERMEELFSIKPAYRAHGVLIERMEETQDANLVIREEKAKADKHTEMA